MMKKIAKVIFLLSALLAGEAMAATCTSIATGNWSTKSTWGTAAAGCVGATNGIPGAADTVILASPYTVTLNNNYSATNLTINAGGTLNDNGNDLTVSGSVAINGTYDGSGNNGHLIMTGNGQTLSGTGTVIDIKRIQIDANITIPAGSNLNLTLQSEIRVGDNAAATLTINGTITGTAQTNRNRLIRVDNNNASNVIINGTINAPYSSVEVQAGGTVTNNGTVTLQYLDGNGDATANWTQGANSTLTLSQPAQSWSGTFNASATGNTVNFNGVATPFNPATYFNINVPQSQCPLSAGITVTGTSSCSTGGGGGGSACIPTTVAGVPSPLIAGPGDLQLGNNGTINTTTPIVVSGTTSLPVTGTTSASNAGTLPALTPATFPAVGTGTLDTTGTVAAGSYGTINASGNPTVFSGGTYYIDTLNATGPIQLEAGTYYINDLNLKNVGANLANLTVTGAVQLFIGNQLDVKKDGISLNAGGNAGNLQVNLYNGAQFDAGKNNVSFTGLIYSPFADSEVQFDNNATITGAIITAGQIQFGNNTTITYDTTVQGQISSLACPASGPDHYELSLPTASISCLATTATVTACADASSPCAKYTAASGKTATLATSGGTLGTTTVTFDATGVATTTLSYPAAADGTAVSVTLSNEQTAATNSRQCCPDGASCVVADSCSSTFNTAGFIFSAAADGVAATIPTQVAGTSFGSFYLRAVKTNTTTMACQSALTGVQSVDFAYECNNPTTCYAADLMSVNGGTATTIARNNNGSVASYLPVSMTFDANGNAPFTFNYDDVGQVTLHASKAVGGTLLSALTGSSNAFVVKPGGFVLSGIQQTAAPNLTNPAAASAADTCGGANTAACKFVKAGESFSTTVTAVTSTGGTAYNYGKETAPEGVRLTPSLVTGLGLTNNPALNGTFGAFSSGVATADGVSFLPDGVTLSTPFTWNEVGIITLTPSVNDANYLGEGDITGTTSGNVGRFYPDHFSVSGGAITNRADLCPAATACPSSFTYMAERMDAAFTLTAQAQNGDTTTNYITSAIASQNFAKFDPTLATNPLVFGALNDPSGTRTPLTPRLDVSLPATGSFVAGAANVIAPLAITRGASPDGRYTLLNIAIAPTDSDGVAMGAYNIDTANAVAGAPNHTIAAQTEVRYGRMKLGNAYGTELLPLLNITATAQYWDGSKYVTSTDDSLTSFLNTDVGITGTLRNGGTTSVSPASVVFVNGVGKFNLSAPGSGHTGTLTLSTGEPNYLPGTSGTATFGVYQGNNNFIYQRENY